MIDVSGLEFHQVIKLPKQYQVYDFSKPVSLVEDGSYGIGKYNEKRPHVYIQKMYREKKRFIHMGIDIGAPVGTEVFAFFAGEVFMTANRTEAGDYGGTLITRHQLKETTLYVLHGHLSPSSIENKKRGSIFSRGECLALLGSKYENGGWPAHLHFQLSLKEPLEADMPGVVSLEERQEALKIYPDPRLVLGPLY